MVKSFNHIGICVNSIDTTFAWMEKTMGARMISRTEYPDRHQVSAIVELNDNASRFELMEPIGETGTVADFIAKRGEGIHHISLKVENVEQSCADFEVAGCRMIGKTAGLAFTHPKTSFGILYELSDGTFNKKTEKDD